ncbi:hypothetical protein FDA94_03285 [Herbidospora galbida]|uniref:Uncharacterized protein n=1 Tax=Herbidospora galbida TaxID=2575442 RepID=A0A4U3MPW5_9ACTN|nr:hypothetical protein [Herbidospora galbida]TKK90802.1 hypothetical protein FDA94_03285 [Herbidospora galbida]
MTKFNYFSAADDAEAAAVHGWWDARLRAVAGPWSRSGALWNWDDVDEITEALVTLRDLAARTAARHHRLYCLITL